MLFKNSIYSDKELLASKLDPVEFKDIDFTYYYNAVFDWSELKSVKRSNNGWVATIRTWIRRDIAEGYQCGNRWRSTQNAIGSAGSVSMM